MTLGSVDLLTEVLTRHPRFMASRGVKIAAILALLLLLLGGSAAIGIYCYSAGWEHRGNAVAAAQLKVEKRLRQQLERQIVRNAELIRLYQEEQSKKTVVYKTIREEVPRVVTEYVEKPGTPAVPVPDWVVTRGFVRLWDDALFGRMPATAAGAAGAAAAPDSPGDQERSEVGAGIILGNHVANAEQYEACRRQLNALIAFHHDNDSS